MTEKEKFLEEYDVKKEMKDALKFIGVGFVVVLTMMFILGNQFGLELF